MSYTFFRVLSEAPRFHFVCSSLPQGRRCSFFGFFFRSTPTTTTPLVRQLIENRLCPLLFSLGFCFEAWLARSLAPSFGRTRD